MSCSPNCIRLGRPKGLSCECPKPSCDKPNAFFEAEGQITTTSYKEVGSGRGKYEMVPQYNFVGQGQGSFIKSEALGGAPICGGLLYPLLGVLGTMFAVTGLFAIFVLFQPGKTTTTTVPGLIPLGPGSSNSPPESPSPSPTSTQMPQCGPATASAEEIEALAASWPTEHRSFCCIHHGRGCTTTSTTRLPYDCQASAEDWDVGWSERKKAWCCQNEPPLGCPVTTTDAYQCSGPTQSWSFGRRYWCCWHRNTGCNKDTGRHFDDPQTGPAGAGAYPKPAVAPSPALPPSPAAPAVVPAAKPAAGNPASLPYDCEAGYSNWQQGWSDKKKDWCCENAGVGCAVGAAPAPAAPAPTAGVPTTYRI